MLRIIIIIQNPFLEFFYDKQKSVIYNHIIFLFSEIKTCDAKSCLIFLYPETTIYSAGFLFFKLKGNIRWCT
jgi:hypothetical protein